MLILAAFIWVGLSVEKTPGGGFDLSFSHADAKKDKGKSKGNSGKSKGNSGKSKGNSGGGKGNSGGGKGNSGGGKGNSGGGKGNSGGGNGNSGGGNGNSGGGNGNSGGGNGNSGGGNGNSGGGNGNSGGGNGNSGGGNGNSGSSGGGQKFGWSQANQQERMARKEASREGLVETHKPANDLKDLISLNRPINGLLNTNSQSVSEFRDLFFEETGKPKKFSKDADLDELIDEYDLLMMLDKHYGYEVNEYVFRDVRYLLRQRFEEYKELQ